MPSGGRLSARMIAAIRAASRAGITVVIATGRRWRTAQMVLQPLGAGDYLIQSSGAALRSIRPECFGEIIYRRYIAHSAAVAISRAAKSFGVIPVWYDTPERSRKLHVFGEIARNPQLELYSRPNPSAFVENAIFDDLDEAMELVCFGSSTALKHLRAAIDSRHSGIVRSMTWNSERYRGAVLEFVNADASKGAALAWLCERLGVARERVAAVGDDVNDLEMITWAGTGIGVAGGNSSVLAAADWVIPGPESDGAAELIERWLRGTNAPLKSTASSADVAQG